MKTFYLWDLANTLFPEYWDSKLSGFESYEAYLEAKGLDPKTMSGKDYEWGYKEPFAKSWYVTNLAEGFADVLNWTKNNSAFTTGNKEQMDWRSGQLSSKTSVDIKGLLPIIFSTMDYGESNKKTPEMMDDILHKITKLGFNRIVFSDDKLSNCQFFLAAAEEFNKLTPLAFMSYNVDKAYPQPQRISEHLFQVSNLAQIVENEKNIQL